MRVAVFSTQKYDRTYFDRENAAFGHELEYFTADLGDATPSLAAGFPAVCVFVNDRVDAPVLEELARGGTRLVALRCAGFNNVDLEAAETHGITVMRVPAYSPHAVAEHAVTLLMAMNRRICRAWARVREGNFSLDGLIGRDLFGKTVGIVGTGRIGALVARTFRLGLGCEVLAHDVHQSDELKAMGVRYVELDEIFRGADIVSLHCPLTPETHHLIDRRTIDLLKPGVLLVNTSRGALIDTKALIHGLKTGKVGGAALDVYEQEEDLFFEDLSGEVIQDDVFQRLLTFPNVLVTGHQAFFTEEALTAIARTTLGNIADFGAGKPDPSRVVKAEAVIIHAGEDARKKAGAGASDTHA